MNDERVLIYNLFLDSGPITVWTEAPEGETYDGMGHRVSPEDFVSVHRVAWEAYLGACRTVAQFEQLFADLPTGPPATTENQA